MRTLLIIIKVINYLLLAFIWVFTVFSFTNLPESIPTHFGVDNKADAYGSRNTLWTLPAVSTVLFLLLNHVSKNPHSPLLNVPDSMRKNSREAEFFVVVMQLFVALIFANLIYEVFQVTFQGDDEISNRTIYILGAMFFCMFAMLIRSKMKIKIV